MRHRPSCRSRAMHVPRELYPIERALAEHLSHLRGPQRRGLALWVLGAVLAQSACQAAMLAALLPWAPYHALRQRLREWLLDGADKAVPCAAQVDVERCFAPLLRWVLGWWQGRDLALAVDATAHRGDVVALVVSVLYRGSAIPVAWAVLPGNAPGAWVGGRSCACCASCARRCRRAGRSWCWPTAACGARGCGSASATSAGTRCCASSGGRRSRPTAASAGRRERWSVPARPGSAAVGSAGRRAGA